VTFAALNEAAGTTTENGFVEDIPLEILAGGKEMSKGRYQISLPDGTARVLPGLTASQKLNLKRLNKGLPASTTFDINEARSFLGGNIGKLSDPNVAGIEDGLQYGAVVQNGKPVVVSEAGEVLSKRKTTAVERANAGVDESGKSFLGDYAEFNTLDEAKRYAGRLNQRKGASRVMPSEILEGKKDLLPEIQSMLENKNISSELNSPEIGQLVKAFTGAESVSDMTKADQKLFYNRLRALPKLNRQTKLPLFKQRQYTPEQFSRASAATNATQAVLNEQQVAEAIGVPVSDPAVPVIQKELAKQSRVKEGLNERFAQEVIPIAEDVRAFFREFGLNPMEASMNLNVRLEDSEGYELEGYYDPVMKEIALSIDAIDTKGDMTQEQRVNALREVLSHEVIHALRGTDLFTQKEWSLLESAVARTQKPDEGMTYLQWARRPREIGGYADKSPLVQVEEAVADMARDFIGNRKLIGGKPRNLLERIIRFFQKARNLMDGYGFTTFEQVLQAVERGDIGRRQTGKIRTARSTEALLEKTFGTVPARYVKFGDTFSKGPTVVPQTVPESQAQAAPAQTRILDFDPSVLEGAEVRQSRKAVPETSETMPDTIDVDGVQRPTRNNDGKYIFSGFDTPTRNLNNDEIQPTEEGIRNFWRWFGDSDTVDEQGRPMVYYHGTKFPGQIDEFKSDTGMYWATPSPEFASTIAFGIEPNENVPSVLPVYVRSLNAFKYGNLKDVSALIGQIEKRGYKSFIPGLSEDANRMIGAEEIKEIKKKIMGDYLTHEGLGRKRGKTDDDNWGLYEGLVDDIRELGFDGFHVWESGVDNIASFDKTSLKSATANVGSYSPEDAQIMYSRKDLQGGPKIPFEVAPSPDNKERTAAWRLVSEADKVKITKDIGPKAVREASKILGIDSAAFDPIISGQGLFEGHVNPNQILGIRQQFLSPDEVLEFASVLGRILEQKAMIAADGRMTGRETSVIRIQTNVSSPKVADRIYAALTSELGDLGGYTAYKKHIDVFNFTDIDSEALANRFIELLKTNTPDIKARVSHDTIQSAYLENETYGDYLRRKKSANQERLERGIESARSRIIGEFDSAIARAGQRSDGQRGVRRQAPQARGPSDALGRTGKARSLEEIKGPEWLPVPEFTGAESIPAFTQRKPKKDAVSAFGVHYSQFQGLMALDSAFAGSGSAGGERRRFGMGVYGGRVPPGDTARRLYFYVQSKMDVPQKEDVVAGNSVYRVRLDNLYDAETDPLGLAEKAGINADLFEEMVNDAGYDGAVYSSRPGINEPTVVLFGLSDKVPVRPYNEPLPEQPVATITEEQAAEAGSVMPEPRTKEQLDGAVQKAQKDAELTTKFDVPLYNLDASPEALYVAQNPEEGASLTPSERFRYSRRNQPEYDPKAKAIINKNTPPVPDESFFESILKKIQLPSRRDFADRLWQQVANPIARIERQYRENPELRQQLADTSAVTAYEMAQHAHMFMEMVLAYGIPVYRNGMTEVIDFNHKGKQILGLIGVMDMLKSKEYGNLESLAHAYATAVRGERLNNEGKLSPVSPGELKILEQEVNKYINPDTGQPIVKEWFDAWQDFNSYVIQYLKDTGSIDEEGAQLWKKQADYIPFYREDEKGELQFPKVFRGMHTSNQFKSVGNSDKALNVDMISAITGNINAAIMMGMKNVAQQRIIRDQIRLGLAKLIKPGETVGNRNAVNFKVNGKRYTAIIEDPIVYQSLLPVDEISLDGLFGKMLIGPAQLLRGAIVRMPDFMASTMLRDAISTSVLTGAKIIPLVDTARNFFGDMESLKRKGVIGTYDLKVDPDSIRSYYKKESERRKMPFGVNWKNPIMAAWDAAEKMTIRADGATRMAVYNDILARTGNEAEAQYQALNVMNFGRRGRNKVLRLITALSPFINARIQGQYKTWQAGTGQIGAIYETDANGRPVRTTSSLKNFGRFAFRSGILLGLTFLYWSMMHDEEEYINASPEIRDNNYIIPIRKADPDNGDSGLSLKIPIPFDVGVLFKSIPERFLSLMSGQDSYRDFSQSMKRQLYSATSIAPPQAVLPPIEAFVLNKSLYTGRPVVPTHMKNLLPEQQTTFYTNKAIEDAANLIGMSPMKLEHLFDGYFGTLGVYFFQTLDSVYRQGGEKKPGLAWYQYPVVKRFFTTANQPGLQNQLYDLADYMDGITQTMNKLEKDGRYDELATFYAKHGYVYEMRKDVNYIEKQVKKLRDERKIIEQMDIDPESKRVLIEQINNQINAELTTIPMYRREVFGSPRQE
jgi:hypothetical protein